MKFNIILNNLILGLCTVSKGSHLTLFLLGLLAVPKKQKVDEAAALTASDMTISGKSARSDVPLSQK